jgi:hypothetical protein
MVLVVIGLIVGGVLVGQDLIKAAQIRATVTQLEQFNSAVNTFYGKYNALPGDIPDPAASSFGFQPRGTHPGQGDGNGILQGNYNNSTGVQGKDQNGENTGFWVDLSTAHLIEETFNTAAMTGSPPIIVTPLSTPSLSAYVPTAKLGNGNYIYVWSGTTDNASWATTTGVNYFGLSTMTSIGVNSAPYSNVGLTVQQAYAIDVKVDDGLPQSGTVTAVYLSDNNWAWAAGGGNVGAGSASDSPVPTTAATPGSSTTCYDNGNSSTGAVQQYSTEQSGGTGVNCALSIRMQGAAR